MVKARKAGVETPCVYMIDSRNSKIYMEKIEGITAKQFFLDALEGELLARIREVARTPVAQHGPWVHACREEVIVPSSCGGLRGRDSPCHSPAAVVFPAWLVALCDRTFVLLKRGQLADC